MREENQQKNLCLEQPATDLVLNARKKPAEESVWNSQQRICFWMREETLFCGEETEKALTVWRSGETKSLIKRAENRLLWVLSCMISGSIWRVPFLNQRRRRAADLLLLLSRRGKNKMRRQHWFHCQAQTEEEEEEALTAVDKVRAKKLWLLVFGGAIGAVAWVPIGEEGGMWNGGERMEAAAFAVSYAVAVCRSWGSRGECHSSRKKWAAEAVVGAPMVVAFPVFMRLFQSCMLLSLSSMIFQWNRFRGSAGMIWRM